MEHTDKFGVDNCGETNSAWTIAARDKCGGRLLRREINAAADYCGARQMRRTDTEKVEKNQTTKTFLHKKVATFYIYYKFLLW
jgi:hypothetical protein